ncbi:protein SGT1 homolog [Liolophura sinensis]|uniref:protein SGT1 homolog n=1 Tax=Liolophura sinensis TaxID=3198878 RepID=UPI003158C791
MAADLFGQANAEFVAENYQRALELYTLAINGDSTKDEYYVNRSHANIKLEKYKDAVVDADQAIKLNPKNAKAYLRKGTALFAQKNFKSAKEEFVKGAEIDESDTSLKTLIRKCEAEMELQSKDDLPSQKGPSVGGGDMKEQTSSNSVMDAKQETTKVVPPAEESVPKIRHDWYQTQSQVIVAVMQKNVKKEDLSVNIEPTSLCITIKLSSGRDYQLNLDLAHEVVPDQSQIKLLTTKIEVKLKKVEGIQWSSLESKGEPSNIKQIGVSGASGADAKPKYPTSSHHTTDWDKLAQNIAKEEKDEKLEGDAALNQLFQQIYADGSDEVKKAMMKSFYESGGTVLSTNWNEIGSQKVEVKPPDGMEFKKWES